MFKKSIIAVVFAVALMWWLIVPHQVSADNDYKVDCALTQLREITSMLIAQDVRDFSALSIELSGVDISGAIRDFSTDAGLSEAEILFNRLSELSLIFMVAYNRVGMTRNLVEYEPLPGIPPQVIVGWMGGLSCLWLWITHERYFGLVDLISDFTGIPVENISLKVSGVMIAGGTVNSYKVSSNIDLVVSLTQAFKKFLQRQMS